MRDSHKSPSPPADTAISDELILKMAKAEEYKAQLMVQGVYRFKVEEFVDGEPFLQARVRRMEDKARRASVKAQRGKVRE